MTSAKTAVRNTGIAHASIPTPDEIAAMTADERQAAIDALDLNSMDRETLHAYFAAAMSPLPRTAPAPGTLLHVRKPQGSSYGISSSGHAYRHLEPETARTFCGAEPGFDITYADVARRRPDYDWNGTHGMDACATCLAKAAELKEQRAANRAKRRTR